jgi:hypothetical protein
MDRTEQNLNEALARLAGEITKADTKAGLIMTLDGLLVAALSLMGKGGSGVALVAEAVGALALAVSVLLALLVIRPRLGAPGCADDRASFVFWSRASAEEIAEGMREDRRQASVRVLSRIAIRKMTVQRAAGDAAFVATVAIAAAALLGR